MTRRQNQYLPILFALCLFTCFLYSFACAGETNATIIVTRKVDCGQPLDVYVNGAKVGTIPALSRKWGETESTPETRSFSFTPAKDGKNTVYTYNGGQLITPKYTSNKLTFILQSGEVAAFVADPTPGKRFWPNEHVLNIAKDLAKDVQAISARPSSVSSVVLNKNLKMKVVKESPPIRLARGTEKVIEDNYKIAHSVTMSDGWNASIGAKAKASILLLDLEADIRSGIEHSTSKSYGTEEWLKRSVTLKGDGSGAKVKVVWVEYFRTGTARVTIEGKETDVPFEFREDFDLLTEDVDNE